MFEDDICTKNVFEKVKCWFSNYVGEMPTDDGMLLVMSIFYASYDPKDAIYLLYMKSDKNELKARVMAKFYKKFKNEGIIKDNN